MGIGERKLREKEQRRSDILNAAERIFFSSSGYERATMDDIAKLAELSKGTLYIYFKNKEEIHTALTLRSLKILYNLVERSVSQVASGIEGVEQVARAFYQFSRQYQDYFNLMVEKRLVIENFDPTMDLVRQVVAVTLSIHGITAACIERGIADGSIRSDLNPKETAILLYGQLNGVLHRTCSGSPYLQSFAGKDSDTLMNNSIALVLASIRRVET